MKYKSVQIQNHASDQWKNYQNSKFSQNPLYEDILKKSIASFISGMIRNNSETIFALDKEGMLVFSTSEIFISRDKGFEILQKTSAIKDSLLDFDIDKNEFVGLATHIPEFNWTICILEDKDSFLMASRTMTYHQIIAFGISAAIIIIGLMIALSSYIRPLRRVRNAINKITINRDFSSKIKVEHPDEIGELAFEFNSMASQLDQSYEKLKKYAVDEAIARREVDVREKESLQVLGTASDYKDPETGAHIVRVSEYSLLLSKALGQPESIQDILYFSSPLHDIGKLGIPDSVILKAGKLDENEFATIKTHTQIGYDILKDSTSRYLKAGSIIALSHHEKFDGTGYPKGLSGEDIPILGRIVSIADVFDALTTKRPYKEPWSFEKACDYIKEMQGSQFDPELVRLFLTVLPGIQKIHRTNKG